MPSCTSTGTRLKATAAAAAAAAVHTYPKKPMFALLQEGTVLRLRKIPKHTKRRQQQQQQQQQELAGATVRHLKAGPAAAADATAAHAALEAAIWQPVIINWHDLGKLFGTNSVLLLNTPNG
jgi:hypothetical protein